MDNSKKFDENSSLEEESYTEELYKREDLEDEMNSMDNDNKFYKNEEYIKKSELDEMLKGRTKKKFSILRSLALILVGSLIGSFIGVNYGSKNQEDGLISNGQAININTKEELNVENAVAIKATPSVVGITVDVNGFGGFFGQQAIQGQNIGSGVVVNKDGYILTNSHVLRGGNKSEINVLFHDNKKSKAQLIWEDETLDLAIIKTEEKNLNEIEMADSDEVRVGDKAIAIGNPVGLNLQSTMTSGYISGLNRSIKINDGNIMDGLFQTDASINSGNSGGALLNSKGQLIGINTAKVESTDGIGFAIPINVAKNIIDSVIKTGSYQPTLIGIKGVNVDIYKQYFDNEIPADKGVVIREIVPNSSASRSDLRVNDIIVGIGDKPVESMNKLKQLLLEYKPGDDAIINIMREGQKIEVKVQFLGMDIDL